MKCLPHFFLWLIEDLVLVAAVAVVRQHLKIQAEACVHRNGSANAIVALMSPFLPRPVKHHGDVALTRFRRSCSPCFCKVVGNGFGGSGVNFF
uniref:Secreted protein n=1 Tax=Ixodes ricinus TaxID=34613 RepID=A0A147BM53_IXORI